MRRSRRPLRAAPQPVLFFLWLAPMLLVWLRRVATGQYGCAGGKHWRPVIWE